MKSFNQFKEESALDAKRLDAQKDAVKANFKNKLEIKRDKRKDEMSRRMDQLERELPRSTADEVIDRLRRG